MITGCQGGRDQDTQNAVSSEWRFVGGGVKNTRNATTEHVIDPMSVARLKLLWSIPLDGAPASNPVSDGTNLYLSTSGGHLYRVNGKDGRVLWDLALEKTVGFPGAASKGLGMTERAIVFGLQNKPVVASIDRQSGALLWKIVIDDHPMASISQPPLAVTGRIFVGTSGVGEEAAATGPDYKCCSFRGSVVALDAESGKLLWKTYDLPAGFAGGSIWSRAPAFDIKRNTLYITTGNIFRAPGDVQACVDKHKYDLPALESCYPDGVWNDSILALDPETGSIKWGFRADKADIFTGSCQVPEMGAKNCGGGLDFDFGNGAMLWHADTRRGPLDLVGAGEKSGMFWAIDAETGRVAWQRWLGPGGENGGLQQGSATDARRIYTALSDSKQVNHDPLPYTLPSGQTINYGSFAALDASNGDIVWQIPDPAAIESPPTPNTCRLRSPRADCIGPYPKAPVSVANGVMFGCSTTRDGPLFAFEAATGKLLWKFKSGASCNTGPLIMDGVVYWASGPTLYAFGFGGS
jgi:polyvinyl alcohol dehydrogenase (cytochrome)